MKHYSIKTVDGSRFDFAFNPKWTQNPLEAIEDGIQFVGIPIDGGHKYFNTDNIVSITEREVDD